MTRNQQIRAVMKLLVVPGSERDECRACIEKMLDILDDFGKSGKIFADQRSAAATKARATHHKVLCDLRDTYKAMLAAGCPGHPCRQAADGRWREVLDLADIEFLIEATRPRPKGKVYSILTPPKQGIPNNLMDFLRDGDVLRFGAGKPTKATEFAHELLTRWGGDQKIVTTRGKAWHKLTAILHNDPDIADPYRYLRAFLEYLDDETKL